MASPTIPPATLHTLETYFPWLRVNTERQVSGSDVMDQLAELYRDLGGIVRDPSDYCDDCRAKWLADELESTTVTGVEGGPDPTGECPDCGGLCYAIVSEGGR